MFYAAIAPWDHPLVCDRPHSHGTTSSRRESALALSWKISTAHPSKMATTRMLWVTGSEFLFTWASAFRRGHTDWGDRELAGRQLEWFG